MTRGQWAAFRWGVVAWCAAAYGQPEMSEMPPAWSLSIVGGIEAAQLVRPSSQPAVLVVSGDAQVHLVGVVSGTLELDEPLAARPGVRLARGSVPNDLAYCFDRQRAYAVGQWVFGELAAEANEFPGDPEKLDGWIDGCATTDGLLLVSRAGRVVLLTPAGAVRWELALGELPVASLHVSGPNAAIVSKSRATVRASFFEWNRTRPEVVEQSLGTDWPIWSALAPEGLVTVAAGQASLWTSAGFIRSWSLGTPTPRAAAMDVLVPAASDDRASATRLVVAEGPRWAAYDVSTGRPTTGAWPSAVHEDVVSLAARGAWCLVSYRHGAAALNVARGTWDGARFERRPGALLQSAEIRSSTLRTLFRSPEDPAAPLVLYCTTLRGANRSIGCRIVRVPEPRQVLWSSSWLVLVTQDSLFGYRLGRLYARYAERP